MDLSCLICRLNDTESSLKMKYTKAQNTTDEQTITAIVIQIIHKTLGNMFC